MNKNMKELEIYSNLKISKSNPIIIRLDGRNFHSLSNDLNFIKPYDPRFAKAMSGVCTDIFKEFSPRFIYSFSDEISILLNELPFNGRVEKIDSVFASMASSSLTTRLLREYNIDNDKLFDVDESNLDFERFKNIMGIKEESRDDFLTYSKPISFDSRIIPISPQEIPEYFKWRQDESWRNCINSYGIWALKSEYPADVAASKLFGLNLNEIKDILEEKYDKQLDEDVVEKRKYLYRDFSLPKFDRQFFVKKEIIDD